MKKYVFLFLMTAFSLSASDHNPLSAGEHNTLSTSGYNYVDITNHFIMDDDKDWFSDKVLAFL